MSKLESLRQHSTVVADTGEIEEIRRYKPTDCTTNPTLLLKAAQMPDYRGVVHEAIDAEGARTADKAADVTDRLTVTFGAKLLDIVPGYVSTECDADLSFDVEGTIAKARRLMDLYDAMGADTTRVLIKIASTWEGMRAAERLQREGIKTNMTLMFSLPQVMAAADAGAFLVSPFVGRIRDWYSKNTDRNFGDADDPGVLFVRSAYAYLRGNGFPTTVMGASFRTQGEIEHLAGCDRLTISPKFLKTLSEDTGTVSARLGPRMAAGEAPARRVLDESHFRWDLNEDAMATEKLAEGIRTFNADLATLRDYVGQLIEGGASAA